MLSVILLGTPAGGLTACRFDRPGQRSNMTKAERLLLTKRNWQVESRCEGEGGRPAGECERLGLLVIEPGEWTVLQRLAGFEPPPVPSEWRVQCPLGAEEDCAMGSPRGVRAE